MSQAAHVALHLNGTCEYLGTIVTGQNNTSSTGMTAFPSSGTLAGKLLLLEAYGAACSFVTSSSSSVSAPTDSATGLGTKLASGERVIVRMSTGRSHAYIANTGGSLKVFEVFE